MFKTFSSNHARKSGAAVVASVALLLAGGIAGAQTTCGLANANSQHFAFEGGSPTHVWDISFQNGLWSYHDLNQTVGTPNPTGGLGCFATSSDVRWVYEAAGGAIWLVINNNGNWSIDNATANSGAPAAENSSAVTGFVSSDGTHHISYIIPNGDIVQIVYNPYTGSWTWGNITQLATIPYLQTAPTVSGHGLTSFATSGDQHWVFQGPGNHVYQIVYTQGSGTIGFMDVTSAVGAPTPMQNTPLGSFLDSGNGQHFTFQMANGHIYQIVFAGGWGWGDITASTPGAPAGSQASAFATSGDQHWVYVSNNSPNPLMQIVYTQGVNRFGYMNVTQAARVPVNP